MKRIYSVLVENRAGVLCKVAGLFWRRCFNIDSLAVGETEDHAVSNMTIVSSGDQRTLEQIEKQLNKKLDVIKVRRLSESRCVAMEMMLIKVGYTDKTRSQILEICLINEAKIVHMSTKSLIIEMHAAPDEIENFIELMKNFGILEIQRTGTVAVSKD